MNKRWIIEGYSSDKLILESEVNYDDSSEEKIILLLQRLVSKHCLSDEEIIAASLGDRSDFEITRDITGKLTLMTSGDPVFAARLEAGEVQS